MAALVLAAWALHRHQRETRMSDRGGGVVAVGETSFCLSFCVRLCVCVGVQQQQQQKREILPFSFVIFLVSDTDIFIHSVIVSAFRRGQRLIIHLLRY